jgi:transcriptional regulator with XRE-family HTH domain
MVADLLDRAGLTLDAAARLCGVTSRTIMNWRDGKTAIPATARDLLESAAADTDLESAEPMTPAERLAVLRHIQQEQKARIVRLESALADEREALTDTNRQINQLVHQEKRL